MKVRSVSYVGSFTDARSFPRGAIPEISFLGRSNVGKSSIINSLLGRRGVARTSNTPGKTRTANWYLINDTFYFVDMPGYGYAKVPQEERSRWRALIQRYVADREALMGIVHLLDIRHTPNQADRDLAASVEKARKRLCLAFNKADKLGRNRIPGAIAEHLEALEVAKSTAVVAYSSETGAGRDELWTWIVESLDGAS